LTGMEKWCGLCVMPWNRAKKVKDIDDSVWESRGDGTVVRKQPGQGNDQSDAERGGPYIQRITNDAREDEMEDNMQAVGSILGNLKSMATDMGSEIEKQNKQLDTIGTKTAGADIMINQANKRTEKLLK
jgi:synaptosomal-associated protein 25